MNRRAIILIVFIIFIAGGIFAWQYWWGPKEEVEIELNLTTTKLATLPGEGRVSYITFSPDGRRVAYVIEESISPYEPGRDIVVVDGQKSEAYNMAYDLTFSPDGKHFAYAMTREEKILNPEEGTYVHIMGKHFIVLDGKEGQSYNYAAQDPVFSPDSQRFAYVAGENQEYFVVLDGKKEKISSKGGMRDLVFSPDSQRFAYEVEIPIGDGAEYFMVIDGKKQSKYYSILDFTFSPDSKHFAYVAEGKIVFDGNENQNSTNLGTVCPFPTFSADSQHLAYGIEEQGSYFIILDDKKVKEYGSMVREYSNRIIIRAGWYPNRSPVFSSNLEHFAYSAYREKDRKDFIVLDDVKDGKGYQFISLPVFSPDSKHLAYVVEEEGKLFVVVDEKESSAYNGISYGPVFTSDSKYVCYGAKIGNELWWIVDEVE